MADIIDKIGKYFAEQEAQMREVYARAAMSAVAAVEPPRVAPARTPQQPTQESRGTPSLLRRRLSWTANATTPVSSSDTQKPQQPHTDEGVVAVKRRLSVGAVEAAKRDRDNQQQHAAVSSSTDEATTLGTDTWASASDAASSTPSLTKKKKTAVKKKKKKKAPTKNNSEAERELERERAQQRAAEGLLRAQERARRIQQEKLLQEKQQQLEREANTARLQEEMRKIEEIRQKGKQFAMRLRPQSAPSTPKVVHRGEDCSTSFSARSIDDINGEVQQSEARGGFLDGLEEKMRQQMMMEMVINERAHRKHEHEEIEWKRLQAQLKKTTDRNAIKQERVTSLLEAKRALEKQIGDAQNEIITARDERHRLEERTKRERQQKLRGAEREINARLRQEESQRLMDAERQQSNEATEARNKAKQRVQSRATLLKKVLHGFDIRPDTKARSTNQEETPRIREGQTSKVDEIGPELAEFEEDGLVEDVLLHPTTVNSGITSSSPFVWRVPLLPTTEVHKIILEELLQSSDSEDEGRQGGEVY